MATRTYPQTMTSTTLNGGAIASILAAGIGAFAMGLVVLLNEMGLFAPPSLYPPAGGVTGRTTFAVLVWLAAWYVLHARWRTREITAPGRVFVVTLVLVAAGVLATFPPVWKWVS